MRLLNDVFAAHTMKDALLRLENITEFLKKICKPQLIDWLDGSIEMSLGVLALPVEHRKKSRSTNMLERLNQEYKRRSKVVRIFPNDASCLRLLTAIAMEASEEWIGKPYLNMDVKQQEGHE